MDIVGDVYCHYTEEINWVTNEGHTNTYDLDRRISGR